MAAAVLLLGLIGAERSRQVTRSDRALADTRVVATIATGVAADLERGIAAVASVAEDVALVGVAAAGPQSVATIPGATTIGFLPAELPSGGDVAPLDAVDRSDPEVAALLDRTRDSGVAAPSAAAELAGRPMTLLIAPSFVAGSDPLPPRTAEDRRARLLGWVVAPVDLGSLADARLPDGAVVSIAAGDGSSVEAVAGIPERLPSQDVEVEGVVVTVTGGDPTGIPLSTLTILLVVAGLVGAAVSSAGALLVAQRLRSQRDALEHGATQVRLISEVAPLVQQSLDLGEVLPAVAVQLTDHFGLAGVRLSTGAGRSSQVELFTLGVRPPVSTKPVLRAPARVAAGESLTLALQRGGRGIALLELVAGRDLDESDLQSLGAITELVTAAVVNASLYASQQAAVRRLRDLDALKTVFLSTASHELRTPATAISGFATLLTTSWDRFDDEQRRDFTARIAANARSLGAVVQDLLDLSLLDRGEVPLDLVDVDLGEVALAVVERLGPLFTDHAVVCAVSPAPPVAGDVNGLERVVTNLLTNAVKFSPAGSTVSVAAGPDGDGAFLQVSDEGPGVPSEDRQRVFVRFYRGDGEAVVQTRGVGIGLSVVSDLVARMGGSIVLDDAPGGGARFRVWLPTGSPRTAKEEANHATTS